MKKHAFRRPRILLSVLLVLFTVPKIFGFDFFGIEIGGSLDEMTSRLEKIGYNVVYFTPKSGSNAGKRIVFGDDTFRAFNRKDKDETSTVLVYMGDEEVKSITLECKTARTLNRLNKYSADVIADLLNDFNQPVMNFHKREATPEEISEMQKAYEDDYIPDVVMMWKDDCWYVLTEINYKEMVFKTRFEKK